MPDREFACGEARRLAPPSELLCIPVTLQEDGRVLHSYLLHVPPLESTFNQQQCDRRATSYMMHGFSVLNQMYMSTTRGLPCAT